MKCIILIVLAFVTTFLQVQANGGKNTGKRTSTTSESKPLLEVTYAGAEGDFLLFTVKMDSVSNPKTWFIIRNEEGSELYRELHTEPASLRRIRIPRGAIRQLHFSLGAKKQLCSRTFRISTQIIETIQVQPVVQ